MSIRLKPGKQWSDRKVEQLVCDAPTRSGDPTGTLDIRRSYTRLIEARWRKVASTLSDAIGKRDVLGLNPDKITALPSDNRIQALQAWVIDVVSRSLLEGGGQWLRPMIATSYNRALVRAMRLTKTNAHPSDTTATINALWAFCVTELQGICDAVTQQVMRIAAEAMLHRTQPLPLGKAIQERVRAIGMTRSGAMIELLIVKAFTTGTLDQFEAAGVARVGLVAETIRKPRTKDAISDAPRAQGPGSRINRKTGETSLRTIQRIRKIARVFEAFSTVAVVTAGDEYVCPVCEGIEEENPYTINEARSLIPAHPRCRCAFVPADEDDLDDNNPYHEPAGSPQGGEFASAPGGAPAAMPATDKERAKEFRQVSRGTDDKLNAAIVKDVAGLKVTIEDGSVRPRDVDELIAHNVADSTTLKDLLKNSNVVVKDMGERRAGNQSGKTIYIASSSLKEFGPGYGASVLRHELEHRKLTIAKVPSGKQEERVKNTAGNWAALQYSMSEKSNPIAARGFKIAAIEQGIKMR